MRDWSMASAGSGRPSRRGGRRGDGSGDDHPPRRGNKRPDEVTVGEVATKEVSVRPQREPKDGRAAHDRAEKSRLVIVDEIGPGLRAFSA